MKAKQRPINKGNSALIKKLAQYSAVVSPALALASTANAQIIYTDVNPDFVLTDPGVDGLFSMGILDLDDDNVNDFTLWALSSEQGGGGEGTFNLAGARPYSDNGINVNENGIVGYSNGGLFYVSALNQGALIGPNQNTWKQVNRIGTMVWDYLNDGKFGPWKNDVTNKYMGVHFLGNDLKYHFGWIRMDVFQNPVQITVKEFAYESAPDSSIHAGEINVGVPAIGSNSTINIFAAEKEVFISSFHVSGDPMIITVRDMLGKTVLNQTTRQSTARISLNDLANNVYLVTVSKGHEVKTIKVSIH